MSAAQDANVELVMRVFRQKFREAVSRMETSLGLYEAIVHLSERQFDVVVLHHVLGYDTRRTAELLGMHEATVRSHLRHAKRHIASFMGLRPVGSAPVPH